MAIYPGGDHLLVFVWLSDNRRLAVFVLIVLIVLLVFVVAVIIVRVSGRHRADDEVRPSEAVLKEAMEHVVITRADPYRFRQHLGGKPKEPELVPAAVPYMAHGDSTAWLG
jgi:hypothetical protein